MQQTGTVVSARRSLAISHIRISYPVHHSRGRERLDRPFILCVVITIIVPAHNEAAVIGRLLGQLVSDADPGELDVIVVPNGCTDNTAEVAASFGPPVRVLSIPAASKYEAIKAGDHAASGFPRVYIDADVEIGLSDVRALAQALQGPEVIASAPQRRLALAGTSWMVRWHSDVWARLPEVQRGLFGRGVLAVSETGHKRIANLPPLMGEDLAASLSFAPHERTIVPDASVVVHAPRTFADLLRRRARVEVMVTQVERARVATGPTPRTQPSDLIAIARSGPRMPPRVALFLAVAMLARLRAHRAVAREDFSTWLRDESSRDGIS